MPGGNRPGNWPGRNGSRNFAFSSSSPNNTCWISPSASGKGSQAPGLALNSLARANCLPGAGSSAEIASQLVLVAKMIGMAGRAGSVSKAECISGLGLGEGSSGIERFLNLYNGIPGQTSLNKASHREAEPLPNALRSAPLTLR